MKETTKKLLILFGITVLLKIILSIFIKNPVAFSDDYSYMQLARSLFYSNSFTVLGQIVNQYTPLYPLLVSVSYVFKDMNTIFLSMKIINSIISSLMIIPIYLLSKEFLEEKKAFLITVISMIIPTNLLFSNLVMSENLYYPLFFFSVYFIYKSFTSKTVIWDILTGISVGLAYLTRPAAVSLILIILIPFVYKTFKKHFYEIKKKIIAAIFFLITTLPWFIRNIKLFGFNLRGLFGGYSREILVTSSGGYLPQLITWFVVYIGYIFIASGILFFISGIIFTFSPKRNSKEKIFAIILFSTFICVTILASNHNINSVTNILTNLSWITGRPVGRYVEMLIPLFLIAGFLGKEYYENTKEKIKRGWILWGILITFFFILMLLISSQLTYFSLFPPNNMLLAWIGGVTYLLNNLLLSIWVVPLIITIATFILLSRGFELKNLISYFIAFLILLNIINYGALITMSNSWENNPQIGLGKYLNDDKISNILIDETTCNTKLTKETKNEALCEKNNGVTIIGLKTNDNLFIANPENTRDYDYLISTKEYGYPILKETSKIYIYSLKEQK
ncbi:MAG: glycosyltransferase family 39 protein [Candidatus Nanoarchaeia archaeon]|nr:glycosyltransferase family 39 protein [Candidatus Nanoarchaeia archaeon]